jgi:hypothetical protein
MNAGFLTDDEANDLEAAVVRGLTDIEGSLVTSEKKVDERLGWWCLPQQCHSEVILEHLAAAYDYQ